MTTITETEAREIDGGMPDHWVGYLNFTTTMSCLNFYGATYAARSSSACPPHVALDVFGARAL